MTLEYKGFPIHGGRTYQDYRVDFPGRSRWGTLREIRQDIDAYLIGALPPPTRGGN